MRLTSKHVTLRPLVEDDMELLLTWIHDPELTQYLTRRFPIGVEQEREWLRGQYKNPEKGFTLGIEIPGECPELIGTMGLHDINQINGTATTGAILGNKVHWGHGYASHAKMLLLHYAFFSLNLRRIVSHVIGFNDRSRSYSLKCGYELIGTLPGTMYQHGQYWDEHILVCCRESWLPYWEHYQATGGEFLKR